MAQPAWGFIVSQWTWNSLYVRDHTDKVIVITGANTGLGFEAAKHLSTMNPKKLILAVRDEKKGAEAKKKILEYSGFERVEVKKLDLTSFQSVKDFATKFNNEEERLDILISNAGVTGDGASFNKTKDGYETTLQTNHLSNTLLLHLLLPILRKTASKFNVEPRIVVVSSEVHSWTDFPTRDYPDPLAAMNDPKRSIVKNRYSESKLLNIYMTAGFKNLFKENNDKISIHALNPGFCYSELGRENGIGGQIFMAVMRRFLAKSTEQGSRTLVHAANDENLTLSRGENGRYFSNCGEEGTSLVSRNKKLQQTVWEETNQIIKKYL